MHETGARGSDCQKELTTIRVRPQWSNTVGTSNKTSNEHLIEKHGFLLASETDLILYIRPENYTEI